MKRLFLILLTFSLSAFSHDLFVASLPQNIQEKIANIHKYSSAHVREDAEYVQRVNSGQTAKTLVIGCSDSLVDPALMMDFGPNEVFSHRNISAIVPKFKKAKKNNFDGTSAVLEYAVNHLEVEHIIVMGHGHCGGMKALLHGFKPKDKKNTFIQSWINQSELAREFIKAKGKKADDPETLHALEKEAVKVSIGHLMEFPWIKKRVEEGKLRLHGMHYNLGELTYLDPATGKFVKV